MNEYRDTFGSILRFCSDFAAEGASKGWNLTVKNFDAAGDPDSWPKGDVVGISEFDLELNDGTIEVSFLVVLSTFDDSNNFRLADQMNVLLNKLIPGARIDMFNSNTGAKRGFFSIRNGTRVAPPMSMETRTVQGIMVRVISDQTLRA